MLRPVFITASQNIVVGNCIFISTNQNIVGQCKIMCWPVYFFSQSEYCSLSLSNQNKVVGHYKIMQWPIYVI